MISIRDLIEKTTSQSEQQREVRHEGGDDLDRAREHEVRDEPQRARALPHGQKRDHRADGGHDLLAEECGGAALHG